MESYPELPPNLIATLDQIRDLPINVEQVGTWLWVDSTLESKDALKAAGFRWSRRKRRWWKPGLFPEGHAEQKLTTEETRERHGAHWLVRNLPTT